MLTNRDREIIVMLVCKSRLANLDQLAHGWWGMSETAVRNARRRIQYLNQSGWVDTRRVLARPLLLVQRPILIWRPGEPEPDFDRLAWRVQSRWKFPARQVVAFAASQRARDFFGGGSRKPFRNVCQITHDLHVTSIYLHYLRSQPEIASSWRGEDQLANRHRHQVIPDAIVMDERSRPIRAIEFGGSYSARRLSHFHDGCAHRSLAYEVW